VKCSFLLISTNKSKIAFVVSGSSAEVASSHNNTLGLFASALAIPTRCFFLHLIARDKTFLYLIIQLNRLILALFLFVLLLYLLRFPMERLYFPPLFVTKED